MILICFAIMEKRTLIDQGLLEVELDTPISKKVYINIESSEFDEDIHMNIMRDLINSCKRTIKLLSLVIINVGYLIIKSIIYIKFILKRWTLNFIEMVVILVV